MFRWFNPLYWWAGMKGAWGLFGSNPVGASFIYVVSGIQTAAGYWLTSLAYPEWARVAVEKAPEYASTTYGLVEEFIKFAWEFLHYP